MPVYTPPPDSPSLLGRIGSGLGDFGASALAFGRDVLEPLMMLGRGTKELGWEVSKRLVPLTEQDRAVRAWESARQVARAFWSEKAAKAPHGEQEMAGLVGGDSSSLLNIAGGIGLDLVRDPLAFVGFGRVGEAANILGKTGKTLALTERGAVLFQKALGKAMKTGAFADAAELKASRFIERLALRKPDLLVKPTLNLSMPFTMGKFDVAAKGSEPIVSAMAKPFQALGGKYAVVKQTFREFGRRRERMRAGALVAELELAAPILRAAKKAGDDGNAIFGRIVDLMQTPVDTAAYRHGFDGLPAYAQDYLRVMKEENPRILVSERLLGVETAEYGRAAEDAVIRLQMDLGLAEKRLDAFGPLAGATSKERRSLFASMGKPLEKSKPRLMELERGVTAIEKVEREIKGVALARLGKYIEKQMAGIEKAGAQRVGQLAAELQSSMFPKNWTRLPAVQAKIDRLENSIQAAIARTGRGKQSAQAILDTTRSEVDDLVGSIAGAAAKQKGSLLERESRLISRNIVTIERELQALARDRVHGSDYVERMLTAEARDFLDRQGGKWSGIGKQLSEHHSSQLQQETAKLGSIAEVNRLARSGQVWKGFAGDIFYEDPRVIQTTRLWKYVDSTNTAQLARDLRQFGALPSSRVVQDAPKAWAKLPIASKEVDHLVFPRWMADDLKKFMEPSRTAGAALKVFDGLTSWMKTTTLLPFPGWLVRNLYGVAFNMGLAGEANPATAVRAAQILMGRGKGAIKTKWGDVGADILLDAARREGLVGRTKPLGMLDEGMGAKDQMADLLLDSERRVRMVGVPVPQQSVRGRITTAASWAIGQKNPWMRLMAKGNSFSDDVGKMALFMARVEKGDTYSAAAQFARRYLGDPDMLSKFERNAMSRAIFFYRWTRFNLPLQAIEALRKPGRLIALEKTPEAFTRGIVRPEDQPFVPAYVKAAYGIPYKWNTEKRAYEYFLLGGKLTMADLGMIKIPFLAQNMGEAGEQVSRYVMGLMNPVITAAPDIATGGALLRGGAWKRREGVERAGRIPFIRPEGFLVDPRIATAMRKIRVLNTLDSMVDTFREPSGIRGPEQVVNFLSGLGKSYVNPARERSIAVMRKGEKLGGYRRMLRLLVRNQDWPAVGKTAQMMAEESGLPPDYFTRGF